MSGRTGRTGLRDADYEQALTVVLNELSVAESIKNARLRTLTGLNYDQGIKFFNRAIESGVLERRGRAAGTHYVLAGPAIGEAA